jgi:N-acetylglutamate synthase/N-acetylornithine aminotransferase
MGNVLVFAFRDAFITKPLNPRTIITKRIAIAYTVISINTQESAGDCAFFAASGRFK